MSSGISILWLWNCEKGISTLVHDGFVSAFGVSNVARYDICGRVQSVDFKLYVRKVPKGNGPKIS